MKIRTVKDLYDFLEREKQKWSEEDKQYLGEFMNQEIRVPHFTLLKPFKFQGYGPTDIHYDGGLGFIIQQLQD